MRTQPATDRTPQPAEKARVVVGLDGSGHSDQALEWAVAEAAARGLPLHLVHARDTIVTAWSPMMVVPTEIDDELWVVDQALDQVRRSNPELTVTAVTTTGPAASALTSTAHEGDLLVVGARGRGVLGSILLGSTSLQVATHARCPVVVVRDAAREPHRTEPAPEPGPAGAATPTPTVVVGYDGSPASDLALGFAFAQAAQRDLALDIVASWEPDVLATYRLAPTVAEEVRAAAAGQRQDLAIAAAALWREQYPSVDVRIHVTTELPAPTLVERSQRAALVVVGSRGLGSVRGPLLGSVSSAVLHGAHCPVVVVRAPDAVEGHGTRREDRVTAGHAAV